MHAEVATDVGDGRMHRVRDGELGLERDEPATVRSAADRGIFQLADYVPAFVKPHPADGGQKHPSVVDLDSLRQAEGILVVLLFEAGKTLVGLLLVEEIVKRPAQILEFLLQRLRGRP